MKKIILKRLSKKILQNIEIHNKLLNLNNVIFKSINQISKSLKNNGKIMLCGNGVSAADAQHLAAEFLVRLTSEVNRGSIPALSLAQDTSTLTACLNDYGPDDIFKRVFSGLSSDGDILLAITTSGNSRNVIETLKLANARDIFALGFLGNGGGEALKYCDLAFVVPDNVTARIQESHITAGHALLQYVEDKLLESGWLTID